MKPSGDQIIAEFIYCSKEILNNKEEIKKILEQGIKESGLTLISTHIHEFNPGITAIAIISESHIAVHTYPEADHASIDIFTCSPNPTKIKNLLEFLKKKLKPKTVKFFEINRGNTIEIKNDNWITGFSALGVEIRYLIKKKLLSKRSKYQQIDVIENEHFGKILFLDKDLQIAEKDAYMYNENMVSPIIKSKNSLNNVLVLGGGDGGVVQELLKYNPKNVILVDIDKEVIEVSKELLPEICKNAFNDPRVKIVIDDAYKFLGDKNNNGFDAVIYDLTMHPEAFIKIDREIYLDNLFSKIKNSMNKNGIVTFQCCPEIDEETLKILKRIMPNHFYDINFTSSFIPSYCEGWIFASAKTT